MATQRRRRYPKKHRDFLNKHRSLYEEILKSQGGGCAICGRRPSEKRRLDLDHYHGEPMRLRGALCVICNRALKDFMNREWLLKAAEYVDRDITID
jgi:hypothetical protein